MKTPNIIHALASVALIGGMFVLGTVTPPLIRQTSALICGDGVLDEEEGEHCDDGNEDNDDGCNTDCLYTFCGDGFVQKRNADGGEEECDDSNTIKGDGCSPLCKFEDCGNSVVQADRKEECDDGLANSDTKPDACRKNCTQPRCGDGVTDEGETCDDGNTVEEDACPSTCVLGEPEEEEKVEDIVPEEESAPPAAEELKPAAPTEETLPTESVPTAEEPRPTEAVITPLEEETLRGISVEEAIIETTEVLASIEAETPEIDVVPESFTEAFTALQSNDLQGATKAVEETLAEKPTVAKTVETIREEPAEVQVIALSAVRLVEENLTCLLAEDPEACTKKLSTALEQKEEEKGVARRKKKPLPEETKEAEEAEESEEEDEDQLLTTAQMTVALAKTVDVAAATAGAGYWDTEREVETLAGRVASRLASRLAKETGKPEEEVMRTFAEAAKTGDLSPVRQFLRDAGVTVLSREEEAFIEEQIGKRGEELSQLLDLAAGLKESLIVTPAEALKNPGIIKNMIEPLRASIRDIENAALRESFADRLQLLSNRISRTETEEELSTLVAGLQSLASEVSTSLASERERQTLLQYLIRRVETLLTPEVEAADSSLDASLLGGKTVVVSNLSLWLSTIGFLSLAMILPGLHRRRDRRARRRETMLLDRTHLRHG